MDRDPPNQVGHAYTHEYVAKTYDVGIGNKGKVATSSPDQRAGKGKRAAIHSYRWAADGGGGLSRRVRGGRDQQVNPGKPVGVQGKAAFDGFPP